MADTLLIHFDPNRQSHSWSTVNDAGELTSKITDGSLAEVAEQAGSLKTVVLLDNTVMHLSQVDMPAMNQQKLLRAIPFALEEQLADDIEDMHFVFSREDKDAPVEVAAISRDVLQDILDRFEEVGIVPAAIIPDCLCLAGDSTQWCALFHGEQCNFQYGRYIGNEYDRDIFDTILKAQLKNSTTRPGKILLFTIDGDTPTDISDVVDEDIEVVDVSYNSHPLVVYCGNYRRAMAFNLLQHDFKPVRSGGIAWRRWSVAASLCFIWLATNMGISAYQLHQLRTTNDALQAQSVEIYRKTFPKSKRVVNPRVQMEQQLKELKAGGSGLGGSVVTLIANSAPALAQETQVKLRSVSYRNGRLDITVDGKNLNTIQSLNDKLNSTQGIRSEIISSSSEKNAVTGSLRIQQAAS